MLEFLAAEERRRILDPSDFPYRSRLSSSLERLKSQSEADAARSTELGQTQSQLWRLFLLHDDVLGDDGDERMYDLRLMSIYSLKRKVC